MPRRMRSSGLPLTIPATIALGVASLSLAQATTATSTLTPLELRMVGTIDEQWRDNVIPLPVKGVSE
ncbi:MAG TPA: hypothetical protein VE109_01860 [Acidobacteriaceae bacterium]|nr:hypothetical protein [Acidobacteriaceae bacterium]